MSFRFQVSIQCIHLVGEFCYYFQRSQILVFSVIATMDELSDDSLYFLMKSGLLDRIGHERAINVNRGDDHEKRFDQLTQVLCFKTCTCRLFQFLERGTTRALETVGSSMGIWSRFWIVWI